MTWRKTHHDRRVKQFDCEIRIDDISKFLDSWDFNIVVLDCISLTIQVDDKVKISLVGLLIVDWKKVRESKSQ